MPIDIDDFVGKVERMAPFACPQCGAPQDGAMGSSGGMEVSRDREGQLFVCAECLAVNRVAGDGAESLNAAEIAALPRYARRELDKAVAMIRMMKPRRHRDGPRMPTLTAAQKAAECARIRDVTKWPLYPVLHVKHLGERDYDMFGVIAADGVRALPRVIVSPIGDPPPGMADKRIDYDSIEALVDAGWIGD